jgi:hypothetical protein
MAVTIVTIPACRAAHDRALGVLALYYNKRLVDMTRSGF